MSKYIPRLLKITITESKTELSKDLGISNQMRILNY